MSSCDLQTLETGSAPSQLAEEKFGRGESLSRATTDNVEGLAMLIDAKRKWRYASPSYLGGLGYAPEEFLGSGSRP